MRAARSHEPESPEPGEIRQQPAPRTRAGTFKRHRFMQKDEETALQKWRNLEVCFAGVEKSRKENCEEKQ